MHQQDDVDWTKFKYMVFDAPTHKGIYAERYAFSGNFLYSFFGPLLTFILFTEEMMKKSQSNNPYIELAAKQECIDMQHLEDFFQDIIKRGGEGIVLRDPASRYVPGRSNGFLKHKVGPSILSLFQHNSQSLSQIWKEISRRRSENCTENRYRPMGMRTVCTMLLFCLMLTYFIMQPKWYSV